MAASEAEVISASDDDSESESKAPGTSCTTIVSLLDRLKVPKRSDLARKRKVVVNPPHGKRLYKSANVAMAAVTVSSPRKCSIMQA